MSLCSVLKFNYDIFSIAECRHDLCNIYRVHLQTRFMKVKLVSGSPGPCSVMAATWDLRFIKAPELQLMFILPALLYLRFIVWKHIQRKISFHLIVSSLASSSRDQGPSSCVSCLDVPRFQTSQIVDHESCFSW